ncbi:MAG: hypothetical protein ACKPKO_55215 [Candidatus Fonsibacter sp.]
MHFSQLKEPTFPVILPVVVMEPTAMFPVAVIFPVVEIEPPDMFPLVVDILPVEYNMSPSTFIVPDI